MTLKETQIKVGERLQEAREKKGMSQKTLGRFIGEDVFFIQQLELGLIDPDIGELCVLIHELDLPLSQFFHDFD